MAFFYGSSTNPKEQIRLNIIIISPGLVFKIPYTHPAHLPEEPTEMPWLGDFGFIDQVFS